MTVNLSKRTKTFDEYRKQLDDLADAIRHGEDFKWSHLTGDPAGTGTPARSAYSRTHGGLSRRVPHT